MKEIEVEVRGRLSHKEYVALKLFLGEHGEHIESKKRILLDYSTFLEGEGIKERQRDIRLRVTNGVPEIITKLGAWGGSESRRELSVKAEPGSFDTLVETYAALGYQKAMLCVRCTEAYMYKGVEFAVVEVPGHSYFFEAEQVVVAGEEEKAHAHLSDVCSELGLATFDDQAFFDYIEELNKEANEVFEFASYTSGYFKNRFSL